MPGKAVVLISINSPYPRPTARCVQKLVNEQILNILSVVPRRRVATSSLISLTEKEHKGSIQMGYAVLDLPAINGEPLSLAFRRPRTLWGFCNHGPNACGLDYKSHRYFWRPHESPHFRRDSYWPNFVDK